MERPLGAAILLLLIIGACMQIVVAVHYKYLKSHPDTEKDADVIAAELELQLQGELYDAIKSSTPLPTKTNEARDNGRHSESTLSSTPRVKFVHPQNDASSWNVFKADAKEKLDQFARAMNIKSDCESVSSDEVASGIDEDSNYSDVGKSETLTSGTPLAHARLALPVSNGSADEGKAILVNAKQYSRILKRRLARQLIEEYFRSRSSLKNSYLRNHSTNACVRRPRGPGGRFLTTDEIRKMESTEVSTGYGTVTV